MNVMIAYNIKYDAEIRKIIDENPKTYIKILKAKGKKDKSRDKTYLFDYIMQCTIALNSDEFEYTLKTRLYWLLNKIESFDDKRVRCKYDDKPIFNWNIPNLNFEYKQTCCYECERKLAQLHSEENMEAKYGVKNAFQLQTTIQKIKNNKVEIEKKKNCTHAKNNSFNTSEKENEGYLLLSQVFKNVKRNYKSPEYDFKCDYYIVDEDIYIELNASWTHGGCFYDENDDKCTSQLKIWKEKAKTSKYYCNAIETWTKRDVIKLQTAKSNSLAYLVFWNLDELKVWLHKKTNIAKTLVVEWNKALANYCKWYIDNKNMINKNVPLHDTHNYIIKYFQQDTFFKREKELWKDKDVQTILIANRCKELNKTVDELTSLELLEGFKKSGIYYGYSHFNSLLFKWFIQNNSIKTCYDPCGGWGHRLLGASDLKLYIYNDLSVSTKKNVDKIIKYFKISNTVTYCNDARTFLPNEKFEAMFTCPPYFNVEEYECGNFKNLEEYEAFIDSLFDVFSSRIECKTFGLVIRDDFLFNHDNYSEKYSVKSNKVGHLTKKDNNDKEHLYIFRKDN